MPDKGFVFEVFLYFLPVFLRYSLFEFFVGFEVVSCVFFAEEVCEHVFFCVCEEVECCCAVIVFYFVVFWVFGAGGYFACYWFCIVD